MRKDFQEIAECIREDKLEVLGGFACVMTFAAAVWFALWLFA